MARDIESGRQSEKRPRFRITKKDIGIAAAGIGIASMIVGGGDLMHRTSRIDDQVNNKYPLGSAQEIKLARQELIDREDSKLKLDALSLVGGGSVILLGIIFNFWISNPSTKTVFENKPQNQNI